MGFFILFYVPKSMANRPTSSIIYPMIVDVCLPQIGFILCVHVLCYEFVVSGMISGIKTEPGCPHQRVVLAMKETTLHCILLPTGMDQTSRAVLQSIPRSYPNRSLSLNLSSGVSFPVPEPLIARGGFFFRWHFICVLHRFLQPLAALHPYPSISLPSS